jgi:hypothetical protein
LNDMDLYLEEKFKEFENAFEQDEVCENMIWNLGTSKKRLWVQTHWCACESHVSLLQLSLTWGCQLLVNKVYYHASKRKIACYLRNLTCHNCQVQALQGHCDVRSCFRGWFLGFHVAEGLKSMDLGLHSQSTRHKALGQILMWKGGTSIWCNLPPQWSQCGAHGSLSVWHFCSWHSSGYKQQSWILVLCSLQCVCLWSFLWNLFKYVIHLGIWT